MCQLVAWGQPVLPRQPGLTRGQLLRELTQGAWLGQGGEQRGCSFSLRQLLEQGIPFICYLHTLAIGIEFVPIKTKLALPGILNRLWQSSPLTLSEQFLQIPCLWFGYTIHTGNCCTVLFARSWGWLECDNVQWFWKPSTCLRARFNSVKVMVQKCNQISLQFLGFNTIISFTFSISSFYIFISGLGSFILITSRFCWAKRQNKAVMTYVKGIYQMWYVENGFVEFSPKS